MATTLDRSSTWRADRDRRQDVSSTSLTSPPFSLANLYRPPARPTFPLCKPAPARESIVLGCMHASSMDVIIRQSHSEASRYRTHPTCLCSANAVRPARMVMSPSQQHARTQKLPTLPTTARTVRLSLVLWTAQQAFLLALYGQAA